VFGVHALFTHAHVLQMLPIVEQLANPALKDRHWRAVLALLGADKAVRH